MDDGESAKEITETVRRLLRLSRSGSRPAVVVPEGPRKQRVVLDIEVDGVRCLLIEPLREDPGQPAVVLSPREHEVARMVAKGYPNKTIAAVLDISTWTVGTYMRRIFAKLGVGCRAAMVSKLQKADPPYHFSMQETDVR